MKKMARFIHMTLLCGLALALTGCSEHASIVTNVDERQANIIVVFLDSKGIKSYKIAHSGGGGIGGGETSSSPTYDIAVESEFAIPAMAILNQNGLPQRQGSSLLELFEKKGMMSTDKEESVRYQAGLSQQITNTILMIDGVIEASVQISFPEAAIFGEESKEAITAAVYVKHQGVIDDPNSHLESKIKRLVSGSVNGLSVDDVTVVSDRSRFTDAVPMPSGESLTPRTKEYVKIWSMVMSKQSAAKFRTVFFIILFVSILLLILFGWLIWKVYPIVRSNGGLGELLNPIPLLKRKKKDVE